MDQSSDKPKEIAGASSKTDVQETFTEGVLTRNRTSSITKSVPRPRTRSLSGSSQSDILVSEPEKQSPGSASLVKRASVAAKPPDQLGGEILKGRRRRRTKAQIAADNAAKEESEKKEVNLPGLPITKKTGRPRGRPKKVRTPVETPVETPSSTVTNSPTPSLQNEEPLPPLITSNQESLESPSGDQDTAKLSNQSSYDFDAEDNVTALPPTMNMTLLKKEELTLNEDTPLLKEDVTPSPVAEAKTPHDKDVMVGVEEQSKEKCDKVATKTIEQFSAPMEEDSSSQPAVCPGKNISSGDTVDGGGDTVDGDPAEKPAEEPIKLMDVSPSKATSAEVPSKKAAQSPADVPTTDSVTNASSNFPTNNDEMMDTASTAVTTATVEDTATKVCSAESSNAPTTLTNAESTFADSFLTTCAVTAVTSTTNNATSFTSLSLSSSCGTADTSKSATKTVSSVATVSSSVLSSATSIDVTVITKTTAAASMSVSAPSSTVNSTANSVDTKTPSCAVPLDLPSASVSNNTAKTVVASSVALTTGPTTNTTSSNNTERTVATSNVPLSTTANTTNNSNATNNSGGSSKINVKIEVSSSVPSTPGTTTNATAVSKNSTHMTVSSARAVPMETDIKSVGPSVVSLRESSSCTSEVSRTAKSVMSTVVSSTTSSIATASLASQSILSAVPAVSLDTCTTTATGTTTVGGALSKISSQSLLHNVVATVGNTTVASTAKPSVTTTSTDTARDVAKLDPLPINLNTSLSVTLPTLSSLLTTPSGQQKLVLPLEKLVLPSSLETSASTTGPFMSPPPVSKPGHSCSYVITSMQTKDADPVSLAVSTMAHSTKENSLHSTTSQKVTSTSHGPIISASMASLESKKTEPISVESKLREIAPKTLGLEFHHLTSDISRSSVVKKPELYEVLSNLKAVNRSLGGSESKSSSFMATSTTVGSLIGQNVGKEKSFDQSSSAQAVSMDKEQQHKPRPIAIKPDGMDLLRQIPAAVATSSRSTYPTVHPLFPLPTSNKTANLMTSFDLFRNVPTTQKQYSAAPNISASVLPHLPGSSIAAFSAQKAPPPLISITDGPSQTVLGSVRVKVIDAPASAHQSSLSSLPAHMKVNRQRPLSSQQSSVSAPVVTTSLVSVTGSVPAPPTTYSTVSQQQYMPHPLTIGVHASSSSKVPSTIDVVGIDHEF